MGCGLDRETIDRTVEFHGHWCPGLAIGLRAGEWALQELGRSADEDIVAVVETDSCGVDAIQVLTGCTFGKGNLIYEDNGKMAFSFHRRRDGKSARLVFNAENIGGGLGEKYLELTRKMMEGSATPEEEAEIKAFREDWARRIMEADLNRAFEIKEAGPIPRKARILATLICDECGEGVMESRTRRLAGRTLCRTCFNKLEKRI
jgi:formylmethanofuran dehydrogenase subunit E